MISEEAMNEQREPPVFVSPPARLRRELPADRDELRFVAESRDAIRRILDGDDDRLLVIVGPCSVHERTAALDYAARLSEVRRTLYRDLEIVMRVYFEKPRTCLGWKGLINDPHLDESHDIDAGLRIARQLMLDVTSLRLPVATEFLDVLSQHYLADLVSWGAIGARTTESQIHREMASGLACPIGFKNGTDGDLKVAIDAIRSARSRHRFLGVDGDGRFVRQSTGGNGHGHLVLRGGKVPNYDAQSVGAACELLVRHGLAPRVVIDASHGNSGKQHENQLPVCASIAARVAAGDACVAGVMIESNLIAGNQSFGTGAGLVYGQSVTDACIGWNDTVTTLERLAAATRARRPSAGAWADLAPLSSTA
ncbi:phospho-2-dehydro-3-deoxyheptonate aldolase [Burkholderia ubonensis]|nr:phospho-2-dehydro-3-deoxyheptonate aldolase [Burkholderia ubonensis]KVT96330.1 phospho-2-dehydro-3-deoxyheptonate aldolase [Burkholderia ubonensis]